MILCPTTYATRKSARAAAKAVLRETGALSWVWRCPVCRHWHVGQEADAPAGVPLHATFAGRAKRRPTTPL